jgi:D-sedoheptulose 7-phosphate isomerase
MEAVAERLDQLLARRSEANAAWFAAEAGRLAELCRAMAVRFAAGGRLLATGDVSDSRHVAVEFVHPVIVGKRALPALAVTARELELLAEPDDMVIGFGADVSGMAARGCLVIDLDPPEDDPFVHQELVETGYHVLWELVHVFLEHSERNVHDTGAASFLYPFLGERETDEDAVLEDVRRSILMKAEEIGALREQTLGEGRATLLAAADALLALSTSGGAGNVIAALVEARRRGLVTIALVGYDGGRIAAERLADHVVVTRSQHIPRIQEAQASAYHVLCELIA